VKFPSKINYFKPENYTAEPFIANTGEEARSTEKVMPEEEEKKPLIHYFFIIYKQTFFFLSNI
jgi:hypothetical protein